MGNLKKLYILILIAVLGFLVYVFWVAFDNFSEAQLITSSYILVPAVFFSLAGLITIHPEKNLRYALISAVSGAVLLFVFFNVLWEML